MVAVIVVLMVAVMVVVDKTILLGLVLVILKMPWIIFRSMRRFGWLPLYIMRQLVVMVVVGIRLVVIVVVLVSDMIF